MLPTINRYVAVVKVREPFVEWANAIESPAPVRFDVQSVNPNAYLLPESNSWTDDRERMLKKQWRVIFDAELESIYTDETAWPQKRTYAMFKKWFDVTVVALVFDTVDEEIEREE